MSGELDDFKTLITKLAGGTALTAQEAERAFDIMMSGDATPSQMGAFLMALRVRGESVDEIVGGARAMRGKMLRVASPDGAMDIVGTGGDGTGTFNISTAVAIVTAACGVTIAKHGNRNLSSKSGAADVLTELGVDTNADISLLEQALRDVGLCFMMAPRHHGAMRYVGPTRVELGTRTIFNLLGPMCNPAGVKRQLLGVFDKQWLRPMAEAMQTLGSEKLWVVHGSDGTDELTVTGPSYVSALENGTVTDFEISPDAAGLPTHKFEDLKGGDAAYNAAALKRVLSGGDGAYTDAVLFGTAAALKIADMEANLAAGVERARDAIASGKATATLSALVRVSNQPLPTGDA